MSADTSTTSLKFRMTGALIWLVALIIIVPIWYGHPVNFSPDSDQAATDSNPETVVVEKPFVLPTSSDQPSLSSAAKKPETSAMHALDKSSVSSEAKKTKMTIQKKTIKDVPASSQVNNTRSDAVEPLPKSVKPPVVSVSGKWIIRLAAYRSKEKAHLLYEHLKYDYDVFVKFFPKSRYYSVRVGPYTDKKLAIKDQADLNRVLRVRSQLTKIE